MLILSLKCNILIYFKLKQGFSVALLVIMFCSTRWRSFYAILFSLIIRTELIRNMDRLYLFIGFPELQGNLLLLGMTDLS